MILLLPPTTEQAADAFAVALDVAKGARSVAQTGFTRFEVIESPPLSQADVEAIRAVANAHGATIEGDPPAPSAADRLAALEAKIAAIETKDEQTRASVDGLRSP